MSAPREVSLSQVLSQRPGPRVLATFGLGCLVSVLGGLGILVEGPIGSTIGVMAIGVVVAGRAVVELRTLRTSWRPDETFFALAPADVAVARRLATELAAVADDIPVTAWPAVEPDPESRQRRFVLTPQTQAWVESALPGGVPPGPRPDEQLIRRALGVVVLVSAASAHSSVVRAHLDAAYSEGVPVLGVRIDDSDEKPANLPRPPAPIATPAADHAESWAQEQACPCRHPQRQLPGHPQGVPPCPAAASTRSTRSGPTSAARTRARRVTRTTRSVQPRQAVHTLRCRSAAWRSPAVASRSRSADTTSRHRAQSIVTASGPGAAATAPSPPRSPPSTSAGLRRR
jgi:hypothetical protein